LTKKGFNKTLDYLLKHNYAGFKIVVKNDEVVVEEIDLRQVTS
jgi:hypothetical protein